MSFLASVAPIVAAGAGLAGAFTQAEGAKQSGIAAAEAAAYQAQVAQNNAVIAQQNATYSEQAGAVQGDIQGLKGAAVAGSIKAGQAANNIDIHSPLGLTSSAANVQASSRLAENQSKATILNNAELQAYGYRTQATNFQAQAGLDQLQGVNALQGANLAAQGDILSGVSGVASKWNQFGFTGADLGGGGGGIDPFPGGTFTP